MMSNHSKQNLCLSISVTALALCLSLAVYAQNRTRRETNVVSVCSIDLKDAPAIHGLKLGITVNEFLRVFPSAARTVNRPNAGIIGYAYNTERDVAIDVAWFLDGTLVFVGFHYPETYPTNMDTFTKQMAARFGLPASGWRNVSGVRELKCKRFTVSIGQPDYPGPGGPPYLQLTDIAGYEKFMARDKM